MESVNRIIASILDGSAQLSGGSGAPAVSGGQAPTLSGGQTPGQTPGGGSYYGYGSRGSMGSMYMESPQLAYYRMSTPSTSGGVLGSIRANVQSKQMGGGSLAATPVATPAAAPSGGRRAMYGGVRSPSGGRRGVYGGEAPEGGAGCGNRRGMYGGQQTPASQQQHIVSFAGGQDTKPLDGGKSRKLNPALARQQQTTMAFYDEMIARYPNMNRQEALKQSMRLAARRG